MVLALAFLTMGAMDYYANEKTEDKEFARTMKNSKQSLIGDNNGVEDSMPEGLQTPNPPQPNRMDMVSSLSN